MFPSNTETCGVLGMLGERAGTVPDKIALRDLASGQSFTYAQLQRHIDACSDRLCQEGIGANSFAIVTEQNEASAFVLIMALIKAGAGALYATPSWEAGALRSAADRTGATHMLSWDDTKKCAANYSQLAGFLVFATSGTTGKPKLIVHRPQSLWINALSINRSLALPDSSRILAIKGMHHAAAFAGTYFLALAAGGELVFASKARDPKAVVRDIKEYGITYLDTVSSFFNTTLHYFTNPAET
ncbi:MAG TPA: AMP-binding protein, partial [Rhodocyclaceae bacterium]|nr:AMP-binding protein [Rhodocyclaceae bacterium]